MATESI